MKVNGTHFAQTEQLLKDLYHRAEAQQTKISTVYIDDRCKLRHKIQSVLGKDTSVKLDVFHAVQRITQTLPKRHKKYVDHLWLVFREDDDSG